MLDARTQLRAGGVVQGIGLPAVDARERERSEAPSVPICADLPVCDACLRELFDPRDRRYRYPYINCTDCGPRYSIVRGLPYERAQTTMAQWPMCDPCRAEFDDPLDRRFHTPPIACPDCGPAYVLEERGKTSRGYDAVARAARLLYGGAILAVKGIGGYHLACDGRNDIAVAMLRERTSCKEQPLPVMVRDLSAARTIVRLDQRSEKLLQSPARPAVLAPAKADLPGVAPDNGDLGVMLAHAPLHHLLFAACGPSVLVMTAANRSNAPIAYRDEDARRSLGEIANAFLIGEREIARRIDDSVARSDASGPVILRHARGYAPQAVAALPSTRPIVATGADLQNAVAVVVRGQAFVSQHVGDLERQGAYESFKATVADWSALYEISADEAIVAHDAHPEYRSSEFARGLPGEKHAVQHHRAHVASVLAERGVLDEPVVGFAFDGAGYGDDGEIWGGEVFAGDVMSGLRRVAHLRRALLPGGDAAARFPVAVAAGFLWEHPQLGDAGDFQGPPFHFPARYEAACELLRGGVRVVPTTSIGRLFDTVAALLGFTREIAFEGQAAMWLEHLARQSTPVRAYSMPFAYGELDYVPLLSCVVHDRLAGRDAREIARAFHGAIASAVVETTREFGEEHVVVSGGVFQNAVLTRDLYDALGDRLWTNRIVPPNDAGICLGQAALAACAH
ncbi:MAG TPA: carbamoyltransferase HypF [Candidatus Baltobacteraceae bacterium]|jgi:hydrogenase maturation protein HypF